jgi:hypothetical protein
MITLLCAILLTSPAALEAAGALPAPLVAQDPNPDYDKRLAEAKGDAAKLWELHLWCLEQERRDLSKATLLLIIEADPEHQEARKVLGHRAYDGKWFESYSALSKYRREEEKRMLDQGGLVRFNDGWARPEDIPFLRMGWTKDEKSGVWLDPTAMERAADDERKQAGGWKRQDMTWISPDEVAKIDQNLWKCGDKWLPIEEANAYHSQLFQWWEQPGEHVIALGTLPRQQMDWARWWADQSYPDLVRALGVEPRTKPSFLVLNSLQQYNIFAGGDPALGIRGTEISGSSALHFAYFAEAWVDGSTQPPVYRGQGVCFWDVNDEKLTNWGQYAVRHAAAHSYMEAIDPSWDTISQAFVNPENLQIATFWNEKKIPRWLRYGIASYCERYSRDPSAQSGADPWAFRAWSVQNLRAGGPLDELPVIFAMNLDAADAVGSIRRIHEAGLIVSYILDGDNAALKGAHEAFKAALASGKGQAEAATALQDAVTANLEQLKAYGKFEEGL